MEIMTVRKSWKQDANMTVATSLLCGSLMAMDVEYVHSPGASNAHIALENQMEIEMSQSAGVASDNV
jgi:hypothetical protein